MSEVVSMPPNGNILDKSSIIPSLDSSQKPRRVLACLLCQKRKIKCDRKHPCSHCVKSRVQCVPATQVPRHRRRRFPERELLDRLRKCEDLLRQNNIKFEPLHKEPPSVENHDDDSDEQPKIEGTNVSSPSSQSSERVYGAASFWHAMNQEFRKPDNHSDSSEDDVREADVKKAWDQVPENDNFLFGSRLTAIDISTFHPEPVHIFRLWQIYLENINPLLKVIHPPSLQSLIIEAASNVSNIKPNLEALMFGIYCMSIFSLFPEDCQLMFGSSKTDLLIKYQFGCQQGLLNCGFLRNRDDRHCLTALFFYLLSIRSNSVPQSLSSMLAIAIRIAQRMGCDSELSLSKLPPLEAEMRRRLWWSIVLYDSRIGELSDSRHAILTPIWDCKVPLNVSDSDFHTEMKDPPRIQEKPTEAIFAVIRGELANFVRNTTFHLDFNIPALKPASKDTHDPTESELTNIEKLIEEKYLKFCDPENPLHFTTIWSTRLSLAKWHLVEHWHQSGKNSSSKVGPVRDTIIAHAITMLECDTKLMTSPLAKGFRWMSYMYFPFPAYFQIVQNLKRRPLGRNAEMAWMVMTDNFEARFGGTGMGMNTREVSDDVPGSFFSIFARIILQAWEVRDRAMKQMGEVVREPGIVGGVRRKVGDLSGEEGVMIGGGDGNGNGNGNGVSVAHPVGDIGMGGFGYKGSGMGVGGSDDFDDVWGLGLVDVTADIDADVNLDWGAMGWNSVDLQTSGMDSLPY